MDGMTRRCGVNTRRRGELGERIAESFLKLKGFEILRRNLVYAGREIDLLARTASFVVAVEVKLRCGTPFGGAIEAVDRRKLQRVREALTGIVRDGQSRLAPRVDVVVIDADADWSQMIVRHIESVY
jgi:putative endonuclease